MTPEYAAVAEFYGTRCARRSGVRLMNHIDEGLQILTWIGGSEWSARGFCLHPLVQEAQDFQETLAHNRLAGCSPRAVALAVEYRAVANAALSYRDLAGAHDIALSPIKDVNDMLVADKVQNYKDFLRYHAATHDRSAILDRYFRLWLERLGISLMQFEDWRSKLSA